jgi:hypothetical protein
MEVHIKPETELRLTELACKSGRATDDLVEDALAGYLTEVAEVREMLDGRYDDIKSCRVEPIDGEAFFDSLASVRMNYSSSAIPSECRTGF